MTEKDDAHDAHGHDAQDHGGHDHAHDVDVEPATELGSDERPTPMWVPMLGVVFAVLGGGTWVALSSSSDGVTPPDAPARAEVAADVAKPAKPPRPEGSGSGKDVLAKLREVADARKMEMRGTQPKIIRRGKDAPPAGSAAP